LYLAKISLIHLFLEDIIIIIIIIIKGI